MKWISILCLFALCSCATETPLQDFPPCPEQQIPTAEEFRQSNGNPDILAKLGDLNSGRDWHSIVGMMFYKRALRIDPNHVRANFGAAMIYSKCCYPPKKAIFHWQKVVDHAKYGSPEYAYGKAVLKQLKKKEAEMGRGE